MQFKILVLSLLMTLPAFASKKIAVVKVVRGKVTKLLPGALNVNILKKGERLPQDTSIVTGKKSFVRVVFDDNSIVSIGPNSKLRIETFSKKRGSIINLLKGKVRAKVERSYKKSKQKFFVKTRTAALGVRGTEFQTIYNPENKVTNLLTYKGEVAIKKLKYTSDHEAEQTSRKIVESSKRGKIDLKEIQRKNETLLESLKNELARDSAVVVKQGQFSSAMEGAKKVSLPVVISPVQLNALYLNRDFSEKSRARLKAKKVGDLSKLKLALKPFKQEVDPAGVYDEKTGDYAPKSGGYIDLETGLYIPPSKDANFNEKLNVFVPKGRGGVDQGTGQYLTPKGLYLDPRKGFLLDTRVVKNERKQRELLASKDIINQEVGVDFIYGEAAKRKGFSAYNGLELITKNKLTFSFSGFSQGHDLENNSIEGERNVDIESGKKLYFEWSHSSGGKWQLITGVGRKSLGVDTEKSGDFIQGSDSALLLNFGARKLLSNRLNVVALLSIDQSFIPVYRDQILNTSASSKEMLKFSRPKGSLGLEWRIMNAFSGRFSIDVIAGLSYFLSKENSDITLGSGLGLDLELRSTLWFNRSVGLEVGFFSETNSSDLKGNTFSSDYKTNTSGLEVGLTYVF